ncbi:hypothetical protein ATANTOWER_019334 [Ataeniobius toweri]|uniref:Uncharacterized protein n=1 Tax=Ataeniobius toweri TaxID=208326 RepID=A0ABU7CI34_9TELE|nr:hypothetical protein [Ataeniobius toweri]
MEETRMDRAREREEAKEHRHKMLCEKMEEEKKQCEEMEHIHQDLYLQANRHCEDQTVSTHKCFMIWAVYQHV